MVGSDPHYSNAIDDQTLKKENSLLDFDFNCLRYSIVGIQRIRSNARRGPAINIEIGYTSPLQPLRSDEKYNIGDGGQFASMRVYHHSNKAFIYTC